VFLVPIELAGQTLLNEVMSLDEIDKQALATLMSAVRNSLTAFALAARLPFCGQPRRRWKTRLLQSSS
jgi:hypothetical protein